MLNIPVLRWGKPYDSLEKDQVVHFISGEPIARVSQANGGLLQRDMRHAAAARKRLREIPTDDLIGRVKKAGELYLNATLSIGDGTQSPDEFVRAQSASTGLPEHMCRANMQKNLFVLSHMDQMLDALTRGLPLEILSRGYGVENRGVIVSFQAQTNAVGLVLPSNSPGVHTLWLPVIPMQIRLVLKPGPQEPWTPYRMTAAFVAAGVPAEAISVYPGGGDVGAAVLASCDRSMIFGGTATVDRYKGNPRVQAHGPGFSKILLGDDLVDRWPEYLDLMVESIYINSGRGCINCSGIWASRHTREIAQALAERLGRIEPKPPEDPQAGLAAFTVPGAATGIWNAIDTDLRESGVEHSTGSYGPRLEEHERYGYLRPVVAHCDSPAVAIAKKEYMFPFATVVKCPQEQMIEAVGPTLVCTAITNDESFQQALTDATHIDRLNLGPIPTTKLNWLQPHEGNIVNFLFRARALQKGLGMIPFDFHPRTRIVFGPGKVDALGELAGELGARRVLVVSDPGIIAAGHTEHGLAALRRAGIETHLFDGVTENPTTEDVEAGLALARRYEPELLVGLGGGSSMDCTKGINFLFTNGGRMQDYWGVGKATRPMLPMIAVPTTAGTGSETQSFALISDAQSHVKMACGDKKAAFRVALLDPSLTVTQPRRVTALTGIDAIAHALETYVTRSRNPASLAFSREAWLLLGENFARVLDDPSDLPARSGMQLGACFAGLAIENSMLGAAHALANPLTTNFQIVHGQAVGLMLPHVIRFNGAEVNGWYHDLLECTAGGNGFPAAETGADGLADFVAELAHHAELPSRLSECGVDPNRLPQLAAEAAKQWTGSFNPRRVDEAELLALYQAAF